MTAALEKELEARARRIAARKMGLVNDPGGLKLPDDLWQQCADEAYAEALREHGYDTHARRITAIQEALQGRYFEVGGHLGVMTAREAFDIAMALERAGLVAPGER